ncbi:rRNA biogenesis protein rrp5 [Caminicella sporogenes]|uniref:rRNA biogenesis protein rrp5 n=1 Tax=Caminicella sporogenes TaxID=166485 RepID=UPI00254221ED|nr:rRNA biogenesis protein rrp5 [Caminicella sporogenes]WIF95092.1 rRNA biogenesis protein rrp5 [Caminicella sporogenes]
MNIKIDLNLNAPELVEAIRSLKEELKVIKVHDEVKGNESKEIEQKSKTVSSKENNITLEQVRTKLAILAQSGKQGKVKELIQKYGGSRLSEIDPMNYENLLKDAEEIR